MAEQLTRISFSRKYFSFGDRTVSVDDDCLILCLGCQYVLTSGGEQNSKALSLDEILEMSVGEFMRKYRPPSTTYIIARPGTKLYNILKAVATGHPQIVIVIDESRRPVGFITDTHLLKSLQLRHGHRSILSSFTVSRFILPLDKSLNVPVESIMDRRPPVVKIDQKLIDVIRQMIHLDVSAVIVTDEKERVIGVLTRRHIIRAVLNILLGEPMIIDLE